MRAARHHAVHALLGLAALSRVAPAETPTAPPAVGHPPTSAVASPLPFVDLIAGSSAWGGRPSSTLNLGGQVGLFVAHTLRLSARLVIPTARNDDAYYFDANVPAPTAGYEGVQSKPFSLLYGITAGIVAVSTESFALSPGIAFTRSDVSDYGSMLGFAAPVEWVSPRGIRIGFEVDLGRVLGGNYTFTSCAPGPTSGTACAGANRQQVDRPSGAALWLQLTLGYGFGHA